MEYLERTIWEFTVSIFIMGILQILGAVFYFFYAAEYVDLWGRLPVLILFPLGAAIDTWIAIRMWKGK